MIDVHAHLFFLKKVEIPENLIVINNGLDFETNKKVLFFNHPRVLKALGCHPSSKDERALRQIEENIDHIVAVGEIGLDYYKYTGFEKQRELFRKALEIAEKHGLPVIVHSRKAEKDVLEILKEFKLKVVLHSYTGPLKLVPEFLKLGCYFSIPALIRRSPNFKRLAEVLPLDKILFETDSPFMSPFKGRRNEPKNVKIAYEEVSRIKGVRIEELEKIVRRNFCNIFRSI